VVTLLPDQNAEPSTELRVGLMGEGGHGQPFVTGGPGAYPGLLLGMWSPAQFMTRWG
jgi:hypothetical protein